MMHRVFFIAVWVVGVGCAAGNKSSPPDGRASDTSQIRDQNQSVEVDGTVVDAKTDARPAPADLTPDQAKPCSAGCDDGLACTVDRCVNNVCRHDIEPNFCLIGGACVPTGKRNDECHSCNPSLDKRNWTDDATLCADDGITCTVASCTAGKCGQTAKAGFCIDGKNCLVAGASPSGQSCQVCDGQSGRIVNKRDGQTCAKDDRDCTDDICQAGSCTHRIAANHCLIQNTCYLSGTLDPSSDCQSCQPSRSKTSFTQVTDGTACKSDGISCTNDVCKKGTCTHDLEANSCLIGKTCYRSGDSQPGAECQRCSPLKATDGWTAAADGTPCTKDSLGCTDDICQSGSCKHPLKANHCLIGGSCYSGGQQNPASSCQHCDPSKAGWTAKADGASCASDGLSCTADVCQGGACQHNLIAGNCLVGETCYEKDAESPNDSCSTCQPTLSTIAFQPAANGTSCESDGLDCTDDVCEAGACEHKLIAGNCLIGGTCYAQDASVSADGCKSCIPTQSTENATDQDGKPCDDGDSQTGVDVCLAGACTGYHLYAFDVNSTDQEVGIYAVGDVPGVGTCVAGDFVDDTGERDGFVARLAGGNQIEIITVQHSLRAIHHRMAVGDSGSAIYYDGSGWLYARDLTAHVGSSTALAGVWGTTTGSTRSFFVAGAAGTLSRCNTTNNGLSYSCQDVGGVAATEDLVSVCGTMNGSSQGPLWALRGETREDIYHSQDGASFSTSSPAGCEASGSTPCSGQSGRFRDVWARTPTDVWAVGQNGLVMRYDGNGWQTVAIPNLATEAPQSAYDFHGVYAEGDLVVLVGSRNWAGRDKDLVIIFYNQRLSTWYRPRIVMYTLLSDPHVANWQLTDVGGPNAAGVRIVGHFWNTQSSRQVGLILTP
jgi:hypothetical protein